MKLSVAAARQPPPKPALTAKNLARFDAQKEMSAEKHVHIEDLEYPCNDASYGVRDFSSWRHFETHRNNIPLEHPVTDEYGRVRTVERELKNQKSANLWCESLLTRIEKHGEYQQEPPHPRMSKLRETKIHKMRLRAAKVAFNKWINAPSEPSEARANASSRGGHRKGSPNRRSPSPPAKGQHPRGHGHGRGQSGGGLDTADSSLASPSLTLTSVVEPAPIPSHPPPVHRAASPSKLTTEEIIARHKAKAQVKEARQKEQADAHRKTLGGRKPVV